MNWWDRKDFWDHWVWGGGALECFYCKIEVTPFGSMCDPKTGTVDHLIPKSRGGSDRLSNLVPACSECNRAKANLLPSEFLNRH